MSEESEHVTVTKEVRSTKKARPLEEFKAKESPARGLVDSIPKEELRTMVEESKPASPTSDDANEGAITLATAEESKVLVEDYSHRYDIPPGFVLVFRDKRSGALSTYFTKNAYSALLEKKGYSRGITLRPGAKHHPEEHRYHYIASLVPVIPDRALKALGLLKDAAENDPQAREEFLLTWREWTKPVEEEGYASPDTTRMRTMKSDYNLDRLARTRAYRHLAALYCGLSSSAPPEAEEDEAERTEGA